MMMTIIIKVVVKLEKLLEHKQKMTSSNQIYLVMISHLQMQGLLKVVLIFTFSIYDISKILQLPQQLKENLNLMELFLTI